MLIKNYFFILFTLFLVACHSGGSGNKNDIDSCITAVPFPNSKAAESLVSPDYSGELKNYMGDDETKLDFKHIFKDGKLIKSIFYFENGNIQEEYEFKCGSLHGIQKGYHENGRLAIRTPYRYGHVEGLAEEFDENGMLKMQIVYKTDSVISKKDF